MISVQLENDEKKYDIDYVEKSEYGSVFSVNGQDDWYYISLGQYDGLISIVPCDGKPRVSVVYRDNSHMKMSFTKVSATIDIIMTLI